MGFTLDILQEMSFASLEEFMDVDMVKTLGSALVEVVHVELTDKGGEVVVFEVDREDFLGEFGRFLDNECGSFWIPVDVLGEAGFLEDVVGFADEGRDEILGVGLGLNFFSVDGESHFSVRKKRC